MRYLLEARRARDEVFVRCVRGGSPYISRLEIRIGVQEFVQE